MTTSRVTFRLSTEYIDALDDAVDRGDYPNRSEAIRAAIDGHFDEIDVPTLEPTTDRGRGRSSTAGDD